MRKAILRSIASHYICLNLLGIGFTSHCIKKRVRIKISHIDIKSPSKIFTLFISYDLLVIINKRAVKSI